MVVKVISEFNSISRLKIFEKLDPGAKALAGGLRSSNIYNYQLLITYQGDQTDC